MPSCIENCGKKLVVAINLLLFIVGLAITGCGIYLQVMMADYFDLFGDIKISSATIIIIVGCIVTIITFLGFCGACMENACMMKMLAWFILILLLLEVIAGVVLYFHKDTIKDEMKVNLKLYNTTGKEGVTKIWDAMQQKLECCGVDNYHDWAVRYNTTSTPKAIPDSCCKNETVGCGKEARKNPDSKAFFSNGCFDKVALDATAAGIIGGTLAVIQILAILIACCMARSMAKREGDYEPASQG